MSVEQLLNEFGQRTGLGALSRNDEGVCRLTFDEDLVVDVEAHDDQPDLHLIALVGSLDTDASPHLLRALLAANLLVDANAGSSLALDIYREEIVLHRQLPLAGLEYPEFERNFEAFLHRLEYSRSLMNHQDDTPGEVQAWQAQDGDAAARIRV